MSFSMIIFLLSNFTEMLSYYKNYLIHFEIETQLKLFFFPFPHTEKWYTTFFIFAPSRICSKSFYIQKWPAEFRHFPHFSA